MLRKLKYEEAPLVLAFVLQPLMGFSPITYHVEQFPYLCAEAYLAIALAIAALLLIFVSISFYQKAKEFR